MVIEFDDIQPLDFQELIKKHFQKTKKRRKKSLEGLYVPEESMNMDV